MNKFLPLSSELYEIRPHERAFFGAAWCGPDSFPYSQEEVLIAQYITPDDSDGQSCDVYCCAMPARFYTLKALTGKNSMGEPKKPFTLGTGSGAGEWAATTAKMIAEGMLALEDNE